MPQKQRVDIPLGPLDVSVPHHDAEAGVLRAIRNLVPTGSPNRPRYSAAEGAAQVGTLEGVLALGAHVRSRRGVLSDEDTPLTTDVAAGVSSDGDTYSPATLPAAQAYSKAMADPANQKIYIATGQDGSGLLSQVFEFDQAANTCTKLTDIPTPVSGPFGGFYNGKLVIAGGYDGSSMSAATQIYDIDADSWSTGANMPNPRRFGGSAVENGILYTWAGESTSSGTSQVSTAESYDIANDTWDTGMANYPLSRSRMGSCALSGTLYSVGGRADNGASQSNSYSYDPSGNSWSAITGHKREQFVLLPDGTDLYALGGHSNDTNLTAIQHYDVSGDTWADSGYVLDQHVRAPAGAGLADVGYVFGGVLSGTYYDLTQAFAPAQTSFSAGTLTAKATALERLAAVTQDAIYLVDPANGEHKRVYAFEQVDESRKAQFGQVGDDLWVATATGAGVGTPEQVLQIKDDAVVPLNLPPLPLVTVTQASEGNSALQAGEYAFRYAWTLQDGTIGPASRPYFVTIESANAPATLTFQISQFTLPLSDAWKELLRGLAIFMSEEAFGLAESPSGSEKRLDRLMNAPYYKVLTLTALDTSTTTEWTDVKEAIPTYPQLDDDQLTRHRLRAAALFSYNKRLFLGDTAVDYSNLQGTQNLAGSGAAIGENNAPTVAYQDDGDDTMYAEGASSTYTFIAEDPDGDDISSLTVTVDDGTSVVTSHSTTTEFSLDGGQTWTQGSPSSDSSPLWRVTVDVTLDTINSYGDGFIIEVEATDSVGDTGSDSTFVQVENIN